MTEHYVTLTVNLDDRDSEGNPKYIKNPKDKVRFFYGETVHLTVSVIENGAEKIVATHTIETTEVTKPVYLSP